jgi:hypothetical protein
MNGMNGMTPEESQNAGLSQEDAEPKSSPKGSPGDDQDEVIDDFANDSADTAGETKQSGMSGLTGDS